jgi:hypothetical protein
MTSLLRAALGHLVFARNLDDLNKAYQHLADRGEQLGLTAAELETITVLFGECHWHYLQEARRRRDTQQGPVF